MIYPFRCTKCGVEFDVSMSIKEYETVKVSCPVCKDKKPKRTFYSNGIAVIYTDSGFTKYIGEPNDITPRDD